MSNEDSQIILEEVRALRAEVAELRSLVTSQDPEGIYREEFVQEMQEALSDKASGEFTDSKSFLKHLAS